MIRSSSNIMGMTLCMLQAVLLSVTPLLPPARLSAQTPFADRRQGSPSAPLLLAQTHSRRHAPAAPDPAAPVLKATVDKQKILIGEPVQLMLEATVTGNAPLVWPSLDSLPHFEWVEKHNVDSSVQPGQRYYRQYLTITSFDSGAYAIPPLAFTAGNKQYFTDSIRINIGYTKIDPNKDYHDIKDIIDIPNPYARWFVWMVTLVSLGSLALVIWLVRKKRMLKPGVQGAKAPVLSPYEEAIRQLDELQRQNLPETGAIKTYYSRMGDIFRLYLYRRLGIQSLSETSEEMISQLRRQALPAQQFSELADTLRMSDFVKFAKYQPAPADAEGHLRTIRSAVEELDSIITAEEDARASDTRRVSDVVGPDRNGGSLQSGSRGLGHHRSPDPKDNERSNN